MNEGGAFSKMALYPLGTHHAPLLKLVSPAPVLLLGLRRGRPEHPSVPLPAPPPAPRKGTAYLTSEGGPPSQHLGLAWGSTLPSCPPAPRKGGQDYNTCVFGSEALLNYGSKEEQPVHPRRDSQQQRMYN